METVSLGEAENSFSLAVPSSFYRVWVNIVPSAGDISNCRLDLSVGPIFRRQSRLRSHAIIDIHRVSIPGQAHSGVTETEITTGENYDSNIKIDRFPIHCFLYLGTWPMYCLFVSRYFISILYGQTSPRGIKIYWVIYSDR